MFLLLRRPSGLLITQPLPLNYHGHFRTGTRLLITGFRFDFASSFRSAPEEGTRKLLQEATALTFPVRIAKQSPRRFPPAILNFREQSQDSDGNIAAFSSFFLPEAINQQTFKLFLLLLHDMAGLLTTLLVSLATSSKSKKIKEPFFTVPLCPSHIQSRALYARQHTPTSSPKKQQQQ